MADLTPDVLVIGAGINGAGTFRDLALQGVDVLLVDRGDICSGSSAAPSRMIHGGLRYLEFGEFRLVREALRERDLLLHTARHLVRPLPTFVPLRSWTSGVGTVLGSLLRVDVGRPAHRGGLLVRAGLTLYDRYTAGRRTLPAHEFIPAAEAVERWPHLADDIVGVARYHDAWVSHPERLCLEVVLDGVAAGGVALTYHEVVGRRGGAVVVRGEDGAETTVRPRVVVNAAGPWVDAVAGAIVPGEPRRIGGTEGSHLVIDHPALHELLAGEMLYHETADGRTSLLLPWHGHVLAGTTDIPIDDPDTATTSGADVDYLLAAIADVLPTMGVGREHVVATYVGVRPLPWQGEGVAPVKISRDHRLVTSPPSGDRPFAVHAMVGGKWTTFRAFAEVASDRVLADLGRSRSVGTEPAEIGGARGYPTDRDRWVAEVAAAGGLAEERVAVLLDRYGTTASAIADSGGVDEPFLDSLPGWTASEVAWLAAHERVEHLDDVCMRRTTIGVLGRATDAAIEEMAAVVAPVLGWGPGRVGDEIRRTRVAAAARRPPPG